MPRQIEFDPDKNTRNIRMRGISLGRAATLLEGFVVDQRDERHDYGETRVVAIGEIDGREFVCVYTFRGGVDRVIALRPAKGKDRCVDQAAKAPDRSENA